MQQTAGFGLILTQLKTNSIEVESKFHNICSLFIDLFILVILAVSVILVNLVGFTWWSWFVSFKSNTGSFSLAPRNKDSLSPPFLSVAVDEHASDIKVATNKLVVDIGPRFLLTEWSWRCNSKTETFSMLVVEMVVMAVMVLL